jgi:hypothetical protein
MSNRLSACLCGVGQRFGRRQFEQADSLFYFSTALLLIISFLLVSLMILSWSSVFSIRFAALSQQSKGFPPPFSNITPRILAECLVVVRESHLLVRRKQINFFP